MTELDIEHYVQNPDAFDALTEEQKALVFGEQALPVEGDTKATDVADKEAANLESITDEPKETSDPPDAGADSEQFVLAKDGKTPIPFKVLEDARHEAAELKQKTLELERFANQQQQLIASLQQAKVEDAGTDTTDAQDAVLAAYQGDFPEIADDIMPYVKAMIDKGIKEGLTAFGQAFEQRLTPVEQYSADKLAQDHFNAIKTAHPNYEAELQTEAFKTWYDGLPSLVKNSYGTALQQGTASQVVEVLDAYQGSKPKPDPAPIVDPKVAADKAKEIIAATKKPVPASMTDIPSGMASPTDEMDAILNMTPSQVAAKFQGKSEAEINRILSRLA